MWFKLTDLDLNIFEEKVEFTEVNTNLIRWGR